MKSVARTYAMANKEPARYRELIRPLSPIATLLEFGRRSPLKRERSSPVLTSPAEKSGGRIALRQMRAKRQLVAHEVGPEECLSQRRKQTET